MNHYEQKTRVVEAERVTLEAIPAIALKFQGFISPNGVQLNHPKGRLHADVGDWITRDRTTGHLEVWRNEIFRQMFRETFLEEDDA